MKKLGSVLLLFSFLSCGEKAPEAPDQRPHFETVQLRDGVYAAIATPGRHAAANSGIVDMGMQKILIFDTFLTPDAGLSLKQKAEELIDGEVFIVVNSNFEPDHVRGNQVFTDASLVSTTRTQRGIRETEPLRLQIEQSEKNQLRGFRDRARSQLANATDDREKRDLEVQAAYFEAVLSSQGMVTPTPTTVVWDHKLNFTGSARRVKIIPFGQAVTESDAALYLEKDSLLFSSDLLVVDRHPSMQNSDLQGWRAALDSLDLLPVTEIVPGHGPVTDKTAIARTRAYLDMVEGLAGHLSNGSVAFDDLLPEPPFDELLRRDRFAENVSALSKASPASD